LQLGVKRVASIGECSIFPKKLLDGPRIWLYQKNQNKQGVYHIVALPFTLMYLKAKEEL